eukprot:1159376-Pelagomonas_calceolata.AAC.9
MIERLDFALHAMYISEVALSMDASITERHKATHHQVSSWLTEFRGQYTRMYSTHFTFGKSLHLLSNFGFQLKHKVYAPSLPAPGLQVFSLTCCVPKPDNKELPYPCTPQVCNRFSCHIELHQGSSRFA